MKAILPFNLMASLLVQIWSCGSLEIREMTLPGPNKEADWKKTGTFVNNNHYMLRCYLVGDSVDAAEVYRVGRNEKLATLVLTDSCSPLEKINGELVIKEENGVTEVGTRLEEAWSVLPFKGSGEIDIENVLPHIKTFKSKESQWRIQDEKKHKKKFNWRGLIDKFRGG